MAEPPNALTDLLRKGQTPEEIYKILRKETCLTPFAMREQDNVITVIQNAEASHLQQVAAGLVGGTREYVIVGSLFTASYLNDKARKLLGTDTRPAAGRNMKPWWKLW
jgi:hypothetical protein